MYFVDREKIEAILKFLETNMELFSTQNHWESTLEKKSLERLSHLMIESILDVGNAMIDGFIMRDPGSYEDIIDILVDEKVVTKEQDAPLKEIIGLRKQLVQDYLEINHKEVQQCMESHSDVIKDFPNRVRAYLENELGPVSAFRN
ncbi:type VII toxin-antitoxin system HepT family RNase toxin [Metabacillus iocasae]|uniref:Uncharacterized protein YutE (UPF0331/DUF86 family) n=1 Tax=Priestia iocasae TaxID=2291674 RepID=A0ABS2QZH5_9BACI|nr:DUF86 domain-containing protein [Metabacillus iocasae]MBM7704598.1 uncharacterized protein YutE (UPF0331/DUF86 family) [Metabacillus iocasae]